MNTTYTLAKSSWCYWLGFKHYLYLLDGASIGPGPSQVGPSRKYQWVKLSQREHQASVGIAQIQGSLNFSPLKGSLFLNSILPRKTFSSWYIAIKSSTKA